MTLQAFWLLNRNILHFIWNLFSYGKNMSYNCVHYKNWCAAVGLHSWEVEMSSVFKNRMGNVLGGECPGEKSISRMTRCGLTVSMNCSLLAVWGGGTFVRVVREYRAAWWTSNCLHNSCSQLLFCSRWNSQNYWQWTLFAVKLWHPCNILNILFWYFMCRQNKEFPFRILLWFWQRQRQTVQIWASIGEYELYVNARAMFSVWI